MADVNLTQYYNLYDATKGYTEMLFRAGKVCQSKELNELQSMLKNQIKNVGDTIMTDGNIIEGCQVLIDGTNVTLTKGRIYLGGDVRSVGDTHLTITGIGTETIGALLVSETITPEDDESLLDCATGYDNYGQDGAYRKKEVVKIVVNDPTSSIMYSLTDGQLLNSVPDTDSAQMEKINNTLARRTYDESGNYKVSGLTLVDKAYHDDDNIYISLEPGKAYVKGYEVIKAVAVNVPIPRSEALRQIDNEPKVFRSNNNKYQLNNNSVNTVTKLVSIVQASQTFTRGSIAGGIDYIPLTPVVEVVSVVQGGITYENGVDFQLMNDGIDWSIGSKAPNPGSSYKVTWTYNKTMVKDVDYTLSVDESTDTGYIEFLEGDKPTSGSTFLVNYNFTLCRRDIISLDKDGNVIVTSGQPDILRTVESPSVSDEEVLALGSVLVKPNSDTVTIINNNTRTIPMLDLYKMLERINSLEYNQSITDLDNEAAEGENATELKGVFTDGFLGLTKADVYHAAWTASVDLDNQELTVPFTTSLTNLTVNKSDSYNAGTFGRLLTAPYTEIKLLSQPTATGILRVNSYNAFPKKPTVKLSPEVDNWIDETTVVVQGGTKTRSVTLRRWWYHKGASWAQEEKALWQSYSLADGGSSLGWDSTTVSSTKSMVTSILDSAIMYMRQKTVSVVVQNLEPYVNNVAATFDGKAINLTASSATYRGGKTGTLKADASGIARGSFTVPANTLCGTRELKVYPEDTPSLVGSANYTANGRLRTTTKTVWTERIRLNPTDPLAQSFQFDVDQFLTAVGVYFNDKDTVEPITVQVRNMVNGYPGTTVYAEKVVLPSDINKSTNASAETKITFDDPVYCSADQQYCFTILSNSDADSLWIAETTKVDITTKQQVSKNPYLAGTLFSSSNALTWTAHQSQDMKFNLYGAKFETQGTAVFNAVTGVKLDRLMVTSEESIPAGCTIQWKYAINGGSYMPIETYDDRDLSEVAESVKVKVDITANSYTSPAIALDSLMLVGFTSATEGTYVSKNVNIAEGFNHVKQVVDLCIPANTNVKMYYATDINGNTWNAITSTGSVQKNVDFKTYTFEADLDSTAYNYRCKVELTSTSQVSRPRAQNLRSIMKNM